jgi:hypothetical protein
MGLYVLHIHLTTAAQGYRLTNEVVYDLFGHQKVVRLMESDPRLRREIVQVR